MALLATTIVAAWSDNLPAVPSPVGFIESSILVPALKDQALMGHPAGTRLIGVSNVGLEHLRDLEEVHP